MRYANQPTAARARTSSRRRRAGARATRRYRDVGTLASDIPADRRFRLYPSYPWRDRGPDWPRQLAHVKALLGQ